MFQLAKLSLANRALIALITVFVAVFGVISMGSLRQELIPSVEFPQVTVISAMPGASPEVVDKQVSQPLESALNSVEGLESSTSTSRTGASTINLTFAYGTNLDRARSQVDRAIANSRQRLPEDVSPTALAGNISDFPIVFLAVSSDRPLSELNGELRRLSVPRLQKIPGVRSADVTGGASQHIAVLPDPRQLAARDLTPGDIAEALANSGDLIPAGTLEEDGRTLAVQAGSPITSLADIEKLPVAGRSPSVEPVLLGSIAKVSIADDPPVSITRTDGVETLALSVTKKPDGDTVGISHEVRALLPQLEAELGSNARITPIFDQAPFIERSIRDLTTEGLLGLGFAVVVILVFLLSVRSTLVTAISIPLSLLATFIGLTATGYSLNILTLGALTIAVGRVVDDSIVVIENIKRHLSYGEEKRHAILTAIREVAGAVTASTLTTVAVFLPVAFVGGLAGELFRPFALTVTMALLASLAVALTIVPVLAYWFLRNPSITGSAEEARAAAQDAEQKSWLQRGYLPVLTATQRHPALTLTAGVLILAGTAALIPLMQTNLLGSSGQNSFGISQTLPPGTSLDATQRAAAKTEKLLDGIDGVRNVQLTIGNATGGLASRLSGGTSVANFTVITEEQADQEALQGQVRRELDGLQGAGEFALSSREGGFGTASTVEINIGAPGSSELREATDAVLQAMAEVPGAREVTGNLTEAQPLVHVTVNRAKAVAAGLSETQVARLVAATISPLPAGTVRLDATDYPVLIGAGRRLDSRSDLENLTIPTPAGPVALASFASVRQVAVAPTVTSSNGQRTSRVSIIPEGDNLGALTAQVRTRLDAVRLPAGATAELGGASTQQEESFGQLLLALLAAVAIVYVIMVATFKSLIQPLILLVSVPFAATGAVALLILTGVPLGLPALIGMLMLVGIVVTNAIVLIDLINQYRRPRRGNSGLSVAEAITHGARQRLRPILMTALATVFALTPMALGLTGEGGFISRPLTIVVIGGLVSSTALTLILVPVLYRLVEGRREAKAAGSR